jgi:hypothetical protein
MPELCTDHGQLSRHRKVEIPKFCVVGKIKGMEMWKFE